MSDEEEFKRRRSGNVEGREEWMPKNTVWRYN
jgi:hypothetical protein